MGSLADFTLLQKELALAIVFRLKTLSSDAWLSSEFVLAILMVFSLIFWLILFANKRDSLTWIASKFLTAAEIKFYKW